MIRPGKRRYNKECEENKMDLTMIVLRVIHILAGIFWVGSALVTTAFLTPAVRALGADGTTFLQFVLGKRHLSNYISLSAILTTLAGILLYWRDSAGLQMEWIATPTGSILSVGTITGILAAILGGTITAPTAKRMEALGKEMQSVSPPPKPEQIAQMQQLQKRMGQAGLIGTILLIVTAMAMAIA